PLRGVPFFCQGWFVQSDNGVWMDERHASLWLYGAGLVELRVQSILPRRGRVSVDGATVLDRVVRAPTRVTYTLRGRRWHLLTFDVSRLVSTTSDKIGLKLLSIRRLATS